jgi:hypothetical protein
LEINQGSKNLISSIKKQASNASAQVPTKEKVGFADVITSLGKHAEDGFVTVTKKRDARAVKSSENKKIGRNLRTLRTGCVTSHFFLLFPIG